ncbi:MAG: lipoate--protein ligase family protein [Gemmatimonadales bacterium]
MPLNIWLDPSPRPGYANMAIDQALLDLARDRGERWLRVYQWEPHCLSFGRHEPASRRYDQERIAALGLDVVRRPTGGRAVWHGGEVTYALAGPHRELGGLREAYLGIHRLLLDGLRALGVEGELAPVSRATGVDAGSCFASTAGGEIMVGGRKVVGSAQLRQGSALLQHGSILLVDDQSMVRQVTRGTAPTDLAAPLARVLGRAPQPAAVAQALASAAERWSGGCRPACPDRVLEVAASHFPRFRAEEWTWQS